MRYQRIVSEIGIHIDRGGLSSHPNIKNNRGPSHLDRSDIIICIDVYQYLTLISSPLSLFVEVAAIVQASSS